MGVVTELKDMGVINDSTHLAGASCGAIIVSCVNAGMDLHGLVDKLLEVRGTAGVGTGQGRLRTLGQVTVQQPGCAVVLRCLFRSACGCVVLPAQFADDCRTHGTAGRLRYVIEHFMTKELPADAHLRCSGRTHLQLTRVFPYLKVAAVGGKAAGRSHNAQTCLTVR